MQYFLQKQLTWQIQNINCIVDFSGSVIRIWYIHSWVRLLTCVKLNYTNVVVYGLGDNKLTLGRTITEKMLKTQGKDVDFHRLGIL